MRLGLSSLKQVFLGLFICLFSCNPNIPEEKTFPSSNSLKSSTDTFIQEPRIDSESIPNAISVIEKELRDLGLVNIVEIDSSFQIDLRYASTNNFMHADVYQDLKIAFLQKEVAEKLALANTFLKMKYPNYTLLIYDAARPMHIQKKMWDTLMMSDSQKAKYVSNPKNGGSLHNYGAAVDVSIANELNEELDMGTPFDTFDELAYPVKESEMLLKGLLNSQQVENRKLLREVMQKAGFFNIQTEWWHFNSCTRTEAISKYQLIF